MSDIQERPPTFVRASEFPKFGDAGFYVIVNRIMNVKDDYVSTSLLRAVEYYPPRLRQHICSDSTLRKQVNDRMASIKSAGQREEFAMIFGRVCEFD
jgi:hypothetical protein